MSRAKPSPVSRIAIAEAEYAVGFREERPVWWRNGCKTRNCPGVEVVMGEGHYCPMRLNGTGRCWQEKEYRRKGFEW